MSRVQLQGVFKNTALVSSAVMEQANALAGLDVTAFIPRGAEPGTAGTIDIKKQTFWRRCCFSSSGETLLRWGEKRGWRSYAGHSRTGVDMVT